MRGLLLRIMAARLEYVLGAVKFRIQLKVDSRSDVVVWRRGGDIVAELPVT